MTGDLEKAYVAALKSMEITGPRSLHKMASATADDDAPSLDDDTLCHYVDAAKVNDPLRIALRLALARWDHAAQQPWNDGTAPDSVERRRVVVERLRIDTKTIELFDRLFPVATTGATVIADEWERWYTAQHRTNRFYWNAYSGLLIARGWTAETVVLLDKDTDLVVERLSDPSRTQPYQVKGLVVGHVQSGKTANFTGVIAKAIDAGYRLVIVLTGTTDPLRAQTQRRIDMELVGQENIMRGIDPDDEEALASVDYRNDDDDWNIFQQYGLRPSDAGMPDIHRMTTRRFDYRSLEQGINALDFPKRDRSLPLYRQENLAASDARLLVVKKNAYILRRLVKDLGRITVRLGDLPALIIDDESDQASLNTMSRKKWEGGHTKRTEINRLICQLLDKMPRAQYIGYTATPFANVFVDPTDIEDIFPKDFLISLDPPAGYMGPADFHDLDSALADDERTYATSKEMAHVRLIADLDAAGTELAEAIDAYLLAGAVKLFRQRSGAGTFPHHTMLVHEAMHRVVHWDRAEQIQQLWDRAGYGSATCLPRLRRLYEGDFLPVTSATAAEAPIPSFHELIPFLSEAIERIGGTGSPVLVVNSDQIEGESLDFDRNRVWRILVGGNQLARGFTVEGLTISYYRRTTKQADTLMQMGRWFGYRKGYRDLTRLYITADLYQAFEAACRDEEDFREELRQYSGMVDGRPFVTPAQVRPLVTSRLPSLRPSAPSKMYNAQIVERRTANKEPTAYPYLEDRQALAANCAAFTPLLRALTAAPMEDVVAGRRKFKAWICDYSHTELLELLAALTWSNPESFKADLAWLRTLPPAQLDHWYVVAPQLHGLESKVTINGHGPFSLHQRGVAGVPRRIVPKTTVEERKSIEDQALQEHSSTGGMLLYPMVPNDFSLPGAGAPVDSGDIVLAFRLTLPLSTTPKDGRLITFSAGSKSARA